MSSPKAAGAAVGNFGKQSAQAVTGLGGAVRDGVVDMAQAGAHGPVSLTKATAKTSGQVTKQAVLGAGDVAYSGAQVGAKTVATGAHLVHDVADATKVSAVVGAALHPRHPQRHAESTEPIENYRDDSVFTALRDEATAAATEEEEAAGGTRSAILGLVCWLEIMANFDAGVLPSTSAPLPAAACTHKPQGSSYAWL